MEYFFPSVSGESEKFMEKQKKILSFEYLVFLLTGYKKINFSNNFIMYLNKKVDTLSKTEIEMYIKNLKKTRVQTTKKILPTYLTINAMSKNGLANEENAFIIKELYQKNNTYENETPLFKEIRYIVEMENTPSSVIVSSKREPQIKFSI